MYQFIVLGKNERSTKGLTHLKQRVLQEDLKVLCLGFFSLSLASLSTQGKAWLYAKRKRTVSVYFLGFLFLVVPLGPAYPHPFWNTWKTSIFLPYLRQNLRCCESVNSNQYSYELPLQSRSIPSVTIQPYCSPTGHLQRQLTSFSESEWYDAYDRYHAALYNL